MSKPNASRAASVIHLGHGEPVGAEASSSYCARGSFTPLTAPGRSRKYSPRKGAAISSCMKAPSAHGLDHSAYTRSRLVYRDERGYYFDPTAQGWRPVQSPTVSRGPVPCDIAALLDLQPGAEVIIRDRVMGDPAIGQATQLATSYIPAALAEELPVLSATETGTGGIYDRLEDAGYGPIRWTEAITSRMPGPVEARLLRLPPGVPLLRIVRLAASPSGEPLEVNDTRVNAEEWEISYPISRHASARTDHSMGTL
jgi:UTRA domain